MSANADEQHFGITGDYTRALQQVIAEGNRCSRLLAGSMQDQFERQSSIRLIERNDARNRGARIQNADNKAVTALDFPHRDLTGAFSV
jgi:hypothetical protein